MGFHITLGCLEPVDLPCELLRKRFPETSLCVLLLLLLPQFPDTLENYVRSWPLVWRVSDFKFCLLPGIPLVRCSRRALNREHQWRETLSAKNAVAFLVPWLSGSSRRRPDEASICHDSTLFSALIRRC